MQLSHPIKDLTTEDGKLMRGATGGHLIPYMDTPAVRVSGVGTASNVDKDNLVKYPLNLNVVPDDIWTQLLTKRRQGFLTHLPGKTLTISCAQGALQEEYDTLKAAIEEANRAYEQEKKEVMTLVENDQQAKAKAVDIALERQAQIQKELDNLQL
jgi:hypothetical protein